MISFIVAAHSRPMALMCVLASLCQQTRADWEAIVVDNAEVDAISDQHQDICVMDPRIRYMRTTEQTLVAGAIHGRSLYMAAEIGVDASSGEWLCFPNDDSYYCPWFAERMLRAADIHRWHLVYCDLVAGGRQGHWLLQASPRLCCIDKTNFVMRREWFKGFNHDPEHYPQADGMLIEDLVRRGIAHGRVSEILVVHN